ncbi:hypothetical protein GWI33_000839 [Rhynchophorus ferrugineus]|uniref:Uncharacterized protein n=1 Tax=Rhynchophorus ferrugineus TaxID=354439 RepID=A0A834IP58_RHYFE|nr:hypothetical protein GWI33_000839 [Rhynchophorus ferrugineus]
MGILNYIPLYYGKFKTCVQEFCFKILAVFIRLCRMLNPLNMIIFLKNIYTNYIEPNNTFFICSSLMLMFFIWLHGVINDEDHE